MYFGIAALFFILGALKIWSSRAYNKPRHYEFDGLKEGERNGAKHSVMLQIKGCLNDAIVYSEPLFRFMGLKLDCFIITDPDVAREIFVKGENFQGHAELIGWFSTVFQYRAILGKKKAGIMSEHELGIIRNLDPKNPASTAIFRSCRKRFMEWTARKNVTLFTVDRVRAEAVDLNTVLKKYGENGRKSIESFSYFMRAATNIIIGLGLDYTMKQDTEELDTLANLIEPAIGSIIGLSVPKILFMILPNFLRGLIPLQYWPKFADDGSKLFEWVIEQWDNHSDTWNPEDEQLCLIDDLRKDYNDGKITESDCITTLVVLLFTAGDTTATCMQNICLALAKNQNAQQKCFDELESVNFTSDRFEDTPYFWATLKEGLRYMPSIYRSLVHTVTVPDKIGEYGPFAKDTMVCTAFTGIWFNPKYFHDPWTFKPERYIDANGEYKPNENLFPFHIGKRSCPGQITAYLEMYHYLMLVLRDFELVEDKVNPLQFDNNETAWKSSWQDGDFEVKNGHFLTQKELRIRFVPRTQKSN